MQWGHVSNLIAITDDDAGKRYTYKYNDQGIRTEKVVNGVVHKYYLQGEQIIAEKIGSTLIKFYYDATGICGFNYNGSDYYNLKNIQGDILRMQHVSRIVKKEITTEFDFHSLRKTHASMLAEMGVEQKYIQTRLGHADLDMTIDVYECTTDIMGERGRSALNKLFR